MIEELKILLVRIKDDLKERLSSKRYEHSVSVAKTALEFAQEIQDSYREEITELYLLKIETAAYLHDYAKEIKNSQMLELAKSFDIKIYPEDLARPNLLHGRIAASLVKETYKITDPIILDAIRDHTFGKAKMSLASKIIYLADFLEPLREKSSSDLLYKSKLKKIRSLILKEKNLDKAVLETMNYKISDLAEGQKAIHPLGIEARAGFSESFVKAPLEFK
jgi:predicted HD superfamily hydrolase involved in NAD metabolism